MSNSPSFQCSPDMTRESQSLETNTLVACLLEKVTSWFMKFLRRDSLCFLASTNSIVFASDQEYLLISTAINKHTDLFCPRNEWKRILSPLPCTFSSSCRTTQTALSLSSMMVSLLSSRHLKLRYLIPCRAHRLLIWLPQQLMMRVTLFY